MDVKYLINIGPGIGDWIIAMPMVRRIKLNDSNAFITTLTCSNKKRAFALRESFFPLQKWVDSMEYYSVREPLHDIKMLLRLGFKKYDYYFKSSYTDSPYISVWPNRIMRFAAKKGVGVHLINKPEFTYDFEIPFHADNNVYETSLKLLERIGIHKHEDEDKTDLFDVPKVKSQFKTLGISTKKQIIALVPGTAEVPVTADGKNGTKPAKRWPYEYWDALAKRFISDGYQVIILGGESEREDIQRGSFFDDIELINLCGKTSVMESCAVLCHSVLAVGGDTGMMHCAGAVGTPSLTLFGCTDYKNYLAYGNKSYYITSKEKCSPCFGRTGLLTCDDFVCMKHISTDEVYKKALSIIKEQWR